jgi:transposase
MTLTMLCNDDPGPERPLDPEGRSVPALPLWAEPEAEIPPPSVDGARPSDRPPWDQGDRPPPEPDAPRAPSPTEAPENLQPLKALPQTMPEAPPPSGPKPRLTPEERERILELHGLGLKIRRIAREVERSRGLVAKVIQEAQGASPEAAPSGLPKAGLLDPFRESIREKVERRLTATRILREITAEGYQGKRTILTKYVNAIRAPLAPKKKVYRRFETPPGEEAQVDWTLVRMLIGGVLTAIHVLAVVLAYSRKGFVAFFREERLPALLEGLMAAFLYFGGVTRRVVFDNMSTVVLGRIGAGRQPIWNPRFLEFSAYYGFEPYLCKVRDPDRKGIVEAFIQFAQRDLIRGAAFDSLPDANQAARRWLDEVANQRRHGTTGLVPDEAWLCERDLLIRLPETPFAGSGTEELRQVARDATVSIRGTVYTVPARLARTTVRVRLYSSRFEVLDRAGAVVFTRPFATEEERGRLQLDPDHYRDLPYPPEGRGGATRRLEEAFAERFPALGDFLTGLCQRMKAFRHVHLRELLRLADRYGDDAFLCAAKRAAAARRFSAHAVRRILERALPQPADDPEPLAHGALARIQASLEDVDPGSLDDYAALDAGPQSAEGTLQEKAPLLLSIPGTGDTPPSSARDDADVGAPPEAGRPYEHTPSPDNQEEHHNAP